MPPAAVASPGVRAMIAQGEGAKAAQPAAAASSAALPAIPLWLSIIIPVVDEAALLPRTLQRLAPLRRSGAEIIVVDGGSRDASVRAAMALADRVMIAPRGRASQMNAGASAARGQVLLFLHADSVLPPQAEHLIRESFVGWRHAWGHFNVRIAGRHPLLPVVAALTNLRSRLSGIATGDQGMFVLASAFRALGGFPQVALMEDVTLSKRLKRFSQPACLRARILTSGRRWESNGVLRTMVMTWGLRLAHTLGADPALLAERYERMRR